MANGLLDFISTPEGQGLLSAAFGGLAGARRGQPLNSLGRAGLAGLQGYGGALHRQDQAGQLAQAKELRDMQMAQMRQAQEQQAQQNTWFEGMNPTTQAMSNGQGPTLANAAAIDPLRQMRYDAARVGAMPKADYFKSLEPKERKLTSVAPGASLVDERTGLPVFEAPQKPEAAPSSVREFQYAMQNGYKGTYDQFKTLGPTIMAAAQAPLRNAQIDNITAENAYNLPAPRQAGGSVPVTAPNGQVLMFPNQQAANQFKAQAGIK